MGNNKNDENEEPTVLDSLGPAFVPKLPGKLTAKGQLLLPQEFRQIIGVDGEEWKATSRFRLNELARVELVSRKAFEFLTMKAQEDGGSA